MTLTPEASTPLPHSDGSPSETCLAATLAQVSQALLAQATSVAQAYAALTEFNARLAKVETALGQQIDAYNNFVTNLNKSLPVIPARLGNLERQVKDLQGASQTSPQAQTPPPAPAAPEQPNGAQSCGQAAAS